MESIFINPIAMTNNGAYLYDLSTISGVQYIVKFKTILSQPEAILFPFSRKYMFNNDRAQDDDIVFFYEKFPVTVAKNEIWYVAVTGFNTHKDVRLEVFYDNLIIPNIERLIYPEGYVFVENNTIVFPNSFTPGPTELFRTMTILKAPDRVKYEYTFIPQEITYNVMVEGVIPMYMNALSIDDKKSRIQNNIIPANTLILEIVLKTPNDTFQVFIE